MKLQNYLHFKMATKERVVSAEIRKKKPEVSRI